MKANLRQKKDLVKCFYYEGLETKRLTKKIFSVLAHNKESFITRGCGATSETVTNRHPLHRFLILH